MDKKINIGIIGYSGEGQNKLAEAIKKQLPKITTKTDYDSRSDSYGLLCPNCRANVGSMDNEDNDGTYKSNLYFDYCPECGQRLEVPKD